MGCDIHTAVEVKRGSTWVDVNEWVYEEDEDYLDIKNELISSRNYKLFGLLAGVRSDEPNPLAQGRGLPEDVTAKVAQFHEDNHSLTWFTVAEVMAYDWTLPVQFQGWVNPIEYARFIVRGQPDAWAMMVGGGGVVHLTNDKMAQTIERQSGEKVKDFLYKRDKHKLVSPSYYTQVAWERPRYECAQELLGEALPRAWRLDSDPHKVRFVIGFDS